MVALVTTKIWNVYIVNQFRGITPPPQDNDLFELIRNTLKNVKGNKKILNNTHRNNIVAL